MTIEQDCARVGRPQAIMGNKGVLLFAQRGQENSSPASITKVHFLKMAGIGCRIKIPEKRYP